LPTLYLKEQGAFIKKRSKCVVVEKNSKTLLEIPFIKVDGIVIYGNIQVTTQLINDLLDRGIDIVYMTRNGRYKGALRSAISMNTFLRMAQHDRYREEDYRLMIMKEIVKAKANNQICILRKCNWHNSSVDFKDNINAMEIMLKKANDKITRAGLMGIEGAISAEYFKVFKYMLKKGMHFEKRTRRPARDPVNALLNLGYTFITNEIASLLEAAYFEVGLGFFHGVQYGRKSLALDIVEEFRQPVIDNFVLNIINKGIINESDFEISNEGVVLVEESFGKFCTEYRKYMTANTVNKISYEELFKKQIGLLKESIMNARVYKPYRMVV